MTPARLQIEQHDALDTPSLVHAWNALNADVARASLFTTHTWCAWWMHSISQDADATVLVIRDEAGNIVGLAPFCINAVNGVRWLRFMGRERVSGDHLDIIARSEHHDACLQAVIPHLDRHADEYDGILLGELSPESPTLAAFTAWADVRSFPCVQREHRRAPYIELPSTYDAFLASLSSNMRYHVRRRTRGLLKSPGASIETVRDGQAVQDLLTDFFDLHRERWTRDGLPGNFADTAMQEFLRGYCDDAAQSGMLRIHAIRLDDVTQCVQIVFHHKNTASYYQMGWNPDCTLESPGVVIMAQAIEQAIADGLTCFDFLRGEEEYKSRWTNLAAEQTTLVVGCRLPARAAIAADRLKNGVKSAMNRCLGPSSWERARKLVTGARS